MSVLYILIGFVGLVIGGDLLVRGAVNVALRVGLSPMVIGLTLVGFGTSTPELVTSVQAALNGAPGIAVGNVIGSNICNILLILGVSAVMAPVVINRDDFRRDGSVMAAATLLVVAVSLWGGIGRAVGAVFVILLVLYVLRALKSPAGVAEAEVVEVETATLSTRLALGLSLLGLVLTLAGAHFLVKGAIDIAAALGVSEAVIGLTVVAVGTSLPELVTSVTAALKGRNDLAFGNVVGSNIFNLIGILGVTALIQPLEIAPQIAGFDVWVMLGATALLIAFALFGARLSRGRGVVFLGLYAVYLGALAMMAQSPLAAVAQL